MQGIRMQQRVMQKKVDNFFSIQPVLHISYAMSGPQANQEANSPANLYSNEQSYQAQASEASRGELHANHDNDMLVIPASLASPVSQARRQELQDEVIRIVQRNAYLSHAMQQRQQQQQQAQQLPYAMVRVCGCVCRARNACIGILIGMLVFAAIGSVFAVFYARDQRFCNTYVLVPCNVTSEITSLPGSDLQITLDYTCVTTNNTVVMLTDTSSCSTENAGCPPVVYPNGKLREYPDGVVRLDCNSPNRYLPPMIVMFVLAGSPIAILCFRVL